MVNPGKLPATDESNAPIARDETYPPEEPFPGPKLESIFLRLTKYQRASFWPSDSVWHQGSTFWAVKMSKEPYDDPDNNGYRNVGLAVTSDTNMAKYALSAKWLVQGYRWDTPEKRERFLEGVIYNCDLERGGWCGKWIPRRHAERGVVGSSLNLLLEAYKVFLKDRADDQVVGNPQLRNFGALYEVVDKEDFSGIDVGNENPFAKLGFY